MATTTKKYQIYQKTSEEDLLLIHPETDADVVKLQANGINADNVKEAFEEINENIASITGGGVVTGVKGEAEETYRLGKVNITRENLGLGNVDNTSDANKPISTATQQALDQKQDTLTFDDTPTAESNNPVKSSGIKAALDLKADIEDIPDVSEFITKAVTDLVNYYTKTEIDGKVTALTQQISQIPKFSIEVVELLPTQDISATTIYLLTDEEGEAGNLYTEYIYVNSTWEKLGTQTLDLSGYVTTTALNEAIAGFLDQEDVQGLISSALAEYTKTEDLADIAISGNLSDAIQDATHRVVSDAEKSTWNAKQDALTFDETPTAGSSNPVKSGGIKNAIQGVQDAVDDVVDGATPVAKATAADNATTATTATKLATTRAIGLSGDVTGSANFDGSAPATINASLSNTGVTAGSYSAVTVDAKGRVTMGAQLWEVVASGSSTPTSGLAIGGFAFIELPEA